MRLTESAACERAEHLGGTTSESTRPNLGWVFFLFQKTGGHAYVKTHLLHYYPDLLSK